MISIGLYFLENVPRDLFINGANNRLLCTKKDTVFCSGYTRIVIGDYGAFIEIAPNQMYKAHLIVKPGQEYRINDPKYSKNVKYHWYTINDDSDIKIYHQQRKVAYADYLPGMYYVSPHEIR